MAFALFPAVAGAQSSSGIQYEDAPLEPDGTPSDKEPANSSRDGGESGQSSTEPGASPDDTKGDDSKDGSGAGAAGKGDGGDGQDGAGKGSDRERESAPAPGGSLDAAPTSSEDDSSPLVPILIALAVLAAISIGVVAWRRRRGDDADPGAGSHVSPEAS